MKIALVHPPEVGRWKVFDERHFFFPLGLGYLASVLEQNQKNFCIVDLAGEQDPLGLLRRELKEERPDIVGISCIVGAGLMEGLECAKVSKEYNCSTILGGPMPSAFPDELLRKEYVDMVCVGEGENAVLDLMNNSQPIRKGIVRSTPPDVTKLPFPARHLFDMKKYSPPIRQWGNKKLGVILTSRGCPYSCKFCYKSLFGYKWRSRTADDVLREIDVIVNEYEQTGIYFADDLFTLDKKRVLEICRGIYEQKYDLTFTCDARVDSVDREMLEWLRKAGCQEVYFGIESGSQRMLDLMSKGTTTEQAEKAIRMSLKAGLMPIGSIMVGMPMERKEDLKETISFIRKNPITYEIAYYSPRPQSEWYKYSLEKGVELTLKDWDKYSQNFRPSFNLTEMPLQRLYELVEEMRDIAAWENPCERAKIFLAREKLHAFSTKNIRKTSNFVSTLFRRKLKGRASKSSE